jgi:hypothetical protein
MRMKWFWAILAVLLVNTAYVSAVHPATVFYMGNVLFHLVLGLALSVAAVLVLPRRAALLFLLVSAAFGLPCSSLRQPYRICTLAGTRTLRIASTTLRLRPSP